MSKNPARRAIAFRLFISALLLSLFTTDVSLTTAQVITVAPTAETEPIPTARDAADDPAIWIHPTDPSLSLLFGTDKRGGGLAVYDLAGKQLQYVTANVEPNNVDVRYNFPLSGTTVDIVAFSNEATDGIGVFKINPDTRTIENIAVDGDLSTDVKSHGFCLYHSPITGKFYAFTTTTTGTAKQYELFNNGAGLVDMVEVRTINIGSHSEGCVADDIYAELYFAEEDVALWKYGAEPGDGEARVQVYAVDNNILDDDIEGLAIYYASDGAGYLIASSQGNSQFSIFKRTGGNAHIVNLEIIAGNGIDKVSGTDGIDVTNFPLGSAFPFGLFIAQDGTNPGANQNFKMVPWQAIANAAIPPLQIDTTWDPRKVGAASKAPPEITSFSPTSGLPGKLVIITGIGFLGATEITFNGTPAAVFNIDSDIQIRAEVPTGASSGTIRVTTPAGTGESVDKFTVIPLQTPAAPSNLTAIANGSAQIDLTWSDNSANEDGFSVERHASDGNFVEIGKTGPNVISFSDTGLNSGATYSYRLRAFISGDYSAYSNEASATLETATAVDNPDIQDRAQPPRIFQVFQNNPNPFNPSTTISFDLPVRQKVTLVVSNVLGQRVATLVDGVVLPAGVHKFLFDASDLPGGIFFYHIRAGEHLVVRPMILLK